MVEKAGSLGRNGRWLLRCDCGQLTVATSYCLAKGETSSCGCLRGDPRRGPEVPCQRCAGSGKEPTGRARSRSRQS